MNDRGRFRIFDEAQRSRRAGICILHKLNYANLDYANLPLRNLR